MNKRKNIYLLMAVVGGGTPLP